MENRKRLGELLLEAGKITREQLDKALLENKQTRKRIGRILVKQGIISDEELLEVLVKKLGIPLIDLSETPPERSAVQMIPMSLAERHGVLPIRRNGNRLMVAMLDPTNFFAIDDLRMVTQCEIEPVIAADSDLKKAIQRSYSVSDLVEKSVSLLQKVLEGKTTVEEMIRVTYSDKSE